MLVLMLTSVTPRLRGELSRWLIEPAAGVYVGKAPARVRDRLWEKVVREARDGSAMMVHLARTEQGFAIRTHGDRRRVPVDYDGLTLICMRPESGDVQSP